MPIPDPPERSSVSWGRIRDALAAVHNLETLLKSPRVGASVLAALLPELRASCAILRQAFDGGATAGPRAPLADFAGELLDQLERALDEAARGEIEARERLALEQVVAKVSGDLDAAVELLDLIERAEAATPTELSLEELAKASLAMGTSLAQSEEAVVRLDTRDAECVLVADAHVVLRILGLAIARVRSAGAEEVTVRASCEPTSVTITVAAADAAAAALPATITRAPRRIAPADAIVEAAMRAIGGRVVLGEAVVIGLPRAPS
jgi:hypothetical protein